MKSKSLPIIRSLLSKLHPPLPRSARESQQLLAVLTASFQRQLDEVHPPIERRINSASHHRHPYSQSTSNRFSTSKPSVSYQERNSGEKSGNEEVALDDSSGARLRNVANDITALSHLLDTLEARIQGRQDSHNLLTLNIGPISSWLQNASIAARTSVMGRPKTLARIRDVLPRSSFLALFGSELKRFILESGEKVTSMEVKAISTSSNFLVVNTPDLGMNHTARLVSSLIGLLRERGYKPMLSDMESHMMPSTALHPLSMPVSTLIKFIIAHPTNHRLDGKNFDSLLSVSEIWQNKSPLVVETIQALHPTKPDPRGLVQALGSADARVAYSSWLEERNEISRPDTAPAAHEEKLKLSGNNTKGGLVFPFPTAHKAGGDVFDLRRLFDEINEEQDRQRLSVSHNLT